MDSTDRADQRDSLHAQRGRVQQDALQHQGPRQCDDQGQGKRHRGLANQRDRQLESVGAERENPAGSDLPTQQADAEFVTHLGAVNPTHVLAATPPETDTGRVSASSNLEVLRLEQDEVHTRSNFGGRFWRKDWTPSLKSGRSKLSTISRTASACASPRDSVMCS